LAPWRLFLLGLIKGKNGSLILGKRLIGGKALLNVNSLGRRLKRGLDFKGGNYL